MAKRPLSHYSPRFANKPWAKNSAYVHYANCPYTKKIKKSFKGHNEWGRLYGLYSWSIERSLSEDLENKASIVYTKIVKSEQISLKERQIWSQFLLSQLVRTPTYIKYEKKAREISGQVEYASSPYVGCPDCLDLKFLANRNWCLLVAHEGDFFIRTDNPVLQTGFIELPETYLFYPITPKLCFVACEMPSDFFVSDSVPNKIFSFNLLKGDAWLINFYLARSAENSLIICSENDGVVSDIMFNDVLGVYPQPPFSLHCSNITDAKDFFESIRQIMMITDNVIYSQWKTEELKFLIRKRCVLF